LYNNQTDSPPGSISAGAVAGIVVAATIDIILVCVILWWKGCFGKKNSLSRGDYNKEKLLALLLEFFLTHELFK